MTRACWAMLLVAVSLGPGAVGCGKSRTEAVVVVTAQGLRIPDDIDAVHVQIFDAQNPTPPLWDAPYAICNNAIQTGCVSLPFTMTLIPGARTPSDSTRIVIAAQRTQVDRINDAAIFTFTPGESLRLDFVLYGNCLDKLDCAVVNQVCGPDRTCVPVHPQPFQGEPDLAQGPGPDLAVGPGTDGSVVTDMAIASGDIAHAPPPPDLTPPPDLLGCVPTCGTTPPMSCLSNCNTPCPCPNNTVCDPSSICVACGAAAQPCCQTPDPPCGPQLACINNTCQCGGDGQPCCATGGLCHKMLVCGPDMMCHLSDMGLVMLPD